MVITLHAFLLVHGQQLPYVAWQLVATAVADGGSRVCAR